MVWSGLSWHRCPFPGQHVSKVKTPLPVRGEPSDHARRFFALTISYDGVPRLVQIDKTIAVSYSCTNSC